MCLTTDFAITQKGNRMSDLIDRQAAIRNVCEYECKMLKPCNTGCGSIDALRDLPSIDAELVVRCKDCKHCGYSPTHNQYWCEGRQVFAEHYCSRAERRTDE